MKRGGELGSCPEICIFLALVFLFRADLMITCAAKLLAVRENLLWVVPNINFLTSGYGAMEIVCLRENGIEDVGFFSLVVTTIFICFICKYDF